jgi:hypothetical protein
MRMIVWRSAENPNPSVVRHVRTLHNLIASTSTRINSGLSRLVLVRRFRYDIRVNIGLDFRGSMSCYMTVEERSCWENSTNQPHNLPMGAYN